MILKKIHWIDGGLGYSYLRFLMDKPITHVHDEHKLVFIITEDLMQAQKAYDNLTDHQVGEELRKKTPFTAKKGKIRITAHFN